MFWHKVYDKEKNISLYPSPDSIVICWDGKGLYLCRYRKILTWKFKKEYAFVNLLSKGFAVNNITHWMNLPTAPEV